MIRCAVVAALAGGGLVLVASCAARAVVCDAPASCGAGSACVAGRCETDGGASSLAKSRRIVLDPVEVAFVERGREAPGTLPASVALGRDGGGPAAVLLRFVLPRDVEVVQASLLVDRAEGSGAEGEGVGLHAERVIGPWTAASATWLSGPELRDVRAPSVVLRRGAPRRVRVDVGPLFLRPHGAEPADQGIALVADRSSGEGASIALAPGMAAPLPGDVDTGAAAPPRAPRLELYVK